MLWLCFRTHFLPLSHSTPGRTSNSTGGENVSPLWSPGDEHEASRTNIICCFWLLTRGYSLKQLLHPEPSSVIQSGLVFITGLVQHISGYFFISSKGKGISEQFTPTDMQRLIFKSSLRFLFRRVFKGRILFQMLKTWRVYPTTAELIIIQCFWIISFVMSSQNNKFFQHLSVQDLWFCVFVHLLFHKIGLKMNQDGRQKWFSECIFSVFQASQKWTSEQSHKRRFDFGSTTNKTPSRAVKSLTARQDDVKSPRVSRYIQPNAGIKVSSL